MSLLWFRTPHRGAMTEGGHCLNLSIAARFVF